MSGPLGGGGIFFDSHCRCTHLTCVKVQTCQNVNRRKLRLRISVILHPVLSHVFDYEQEQLWYFLHRSTSLKRRWFKTALDKIKYRRRALYLIRVLDTIYLRVINTSILRTRERSHRNDCCYVHDT